MAAVEGLLGDILPRWNIPPERVIGHACMAPGRKIDPGEKFDWRRLALQGLAVWLDPDGAAVAEVPDAQRFARAAARLGYGATVPDSPAGWNDELLAVWSAVAMRFLNQGRHSGPGTAGIQHLELIADRWPVVDPKPASA